MRCVFRVVFHDGKSLVLSHLTPRWTAEVCTTQITHAHACAHTLHTRAPHAHTASQAPISSCTVTFRNTLSHPHRLSGIRAPTSTLLTSQQCKAAVAAAALNIQAECDSTTFFFTLLEMTTGKQQFYLNVMKQLTPKPVLYVLCVV